MNDDLRVKFKKLASAWRKETRFISSPTVRAKNKNYQKIIAMGGDVVPLLLEELRQNLDNPEDWFWALEIITGENPVPSNHRGQFPKMARHWLQWSLERCIIE